MIRRCLQKTGFTLLEVVIAIALLAVVISTIYGAYSGTLETAEMVETSKELDQAGRLALMQMADDFKSVYYQKDEQGSDASAYDFSGGSQETADEGRVLVEFATTAQLGFDAPGMQINRVRYRLDEQEGKDGLNRLVRVEVPFAGLELEDHAREVELTGGVKELTIEYLDEEGLVISSQWDSSDPEQDSALPRLVRIRLELAGKESKETRLYTLTVAPRQWQETR